jgi:hypothetical protein
MHFYLKHWPDVGISLALGISIAMVVFQKKRSRAPMYLLRDKETPYRFTEQQMGPYGHHR